MISLSDRLDDFKGSDAVMKKNENSGIALGFANLVLTVGLLMSLFLLLYLVYSYAWLGKRNLTSAASVLAYYGLPAFLAALFLICRQFAPPYKVKAALAIVSTAVTVYLFEVTILLMGPIALRSNQTLYFPPRTKAELNEIVRVAQQNGVVFDTRSKLDVLNDLQRQGVAAVPSVVPSQFLTAALPSKPKKEPPQINLTMNGGSVLPLAGISNSVTVLCNETGKYLIYLSDEYGFHNPRGIWGAQPIEIAALGDSYAHGMCVPSEKNFVAVIRKKIPQTLNLGISGNGPLLSLAVLTEYVEQIKPRIVLWFYYEGNDLPDLKVEKQFPILMRYLEDDFRQGLFDQQARIDELLINQVADRREAFVNEIVDLPEGTGATTAWIRDIVELVESIVKLRSLRGLAGWMEASDDKMREWWRPASDNDVQLLGAVLERAKSRIASWNGSLYFVYLPSRDRYVRSELADRDNENRARILSLTKAIGVPVIDLHDVFGSEENTLDLFPFRRLVHYNEEGHALVAETVLTAISKNE